MGESRQLQPFAYLISDGKQGPLDAVMPHGDPDGFFGTTEPPGDCGDFERCSQECGELCRVAEFGVVSPHACSSGKQCTAVRDGWLW